MLQKPPLYVVAPMSITNWKRVQVKQEGSHVACDGERSDNKSCLCVLASAADGLFPLLAGWQKETWQHRPGAGPSNVTDNPDPNPDPV